MPLAQASLLPSERATSPTKQGMVIVLSDGGRDILNIKGLCLKGTADLFQLEDEVTSLAHHFTTNEYAECVRK